MNKELNVYQSITIYEQNNASIEIRGNGAILVEDFESGRDVVIQIDYTQMKAIAAFLRKSSHGIMDGIQDERAAVQS